ncbi:MAG: LysM peptidoglycan-binding domain-containing protein [Oscillospiraceae bacterium]
MIIAKAAVALAGNPAVGYDQSGRTSLFDALRAVGFDYNRLTVKCETDCSALAAVCCNCAGIGGISKNVYSGNIIPAAKATGEFDVLTDKKYLSSADYLRAGDIVVAPNCHVIIMTADGAGVTAPAAKPTGATSTTTKNTTPAASVYTVKKGDTLTAIAKKHGTTVAALVKLNGIKNPNLIHVGQKIKLK